MMSNHIEVRREARRQRKAQWMIGRCYTQPVQITDIIMEPTVIPDITEGVISMIIEEAITIQVHSTSNMSSDMEEAMVIEVEPIIPAKPIDEASEELRKLLILHQTIKKLSSKKKVI